MKDILRFIIKLFLRVMYIFPVNEKKVYLSSFAGNKYGLDAKAFAEYLKAQYPNEYQIYWEIDDIKKDFHQEGVHCVARNSIKDLYHYMTAGMILTNMMPRSYIPFRRKQFIVDTWHGYPMKKVGKYAIRYNWKSYNIASCYISHSREFTDLVLKDSFDYRGEIINCGAPRNDIFFRTDTSDVIRNVKESLHISGRVLLYAPTFRGDYQYEGTELDVSRLTKALEELYGEPWVVLFRLHPQLADKIHDFPEDTLDVSRYHDMQELLLISDMLITDYSSCAWDFVLTRRPVFLFATDLDEYDNDRGLYFPLQELPYSLARNNDELITAIRSFDMSKYNENVGQYFDRVQKFDSGNACQTLLTRVKQHHQGKP